MSARQAGPYDSIARKWLALAERRRVYLVSLRDSGRWRDFYNFSEAKLEDQLRAVDLACARFARIAGRRAPDAALEAVAA